MIKNLILCFLISLVFSVVLGVLIIPLLKRLKAGQPILKYVKEHGAKQGTPTMGGVFIVISSIISYFIFRGFSGIIAVMTICIGLAYMLVGFLDDFLKIKRKENEGLSVMQKILFQTAIATMAGFFAYLNKMSVIFLPFSNKLINLDVFIIPFNAIVFIAITNSVNLTDGLDGLASGTSVFYLLAFAILICLQINFFKGLYTLKDEYYNLVFLSIAIVGSLVGFLLFNINPAKVFMGDTGSLSLGGFIGAITLFSMNALYMPIIGICFVFSSLSVVIQVAVYKKTKRRVFLMAPFHHHLQHKGISENRISFIYSLITVIMGVFVIIFYL